MKIKVIAAFVVEVDDERAKQVKESEGDSMELLCEGMNMFMAGDWDREFNPETDVFSLVVEELDARNNVVTSSVPKHQLL